MDNNFETIIGLEIHVQLNTNTKLFCRCANYKHDSIPNTSVCPTCMGFPGALPVLSIKALEYAIKLGLALNCKINEKTIWYRKNYFYPDLPAGYQISQLSNPISENGFIEILNDKCELIKIRINRAHLENDAGKLVHIAGNTYLDFNRAGTPLMEIVTEPDIRSASQAKNVVQEIQKIVRAIEISDADLESGNMRCDANVSIRPIGQQTYNNRVEIKNLNSFKSIEDAINHEIERQISMYKQGINIDQETRGYNADTGNTYIMRSKEDAHDYRYFPEPDLVPFLPDKSLIEKIKSEIPELPVYRQKKFIQEYGFDYKDSSYLSGNKKLADYIEYIGSKASKQMAKSWVMTILLKTLNENLIDIDDLKFNKDQLVQLIKYIEDGTISNNIAKEKIYPIMFETGKSPTEIIDELGIKQINDDNTILSIIDETLKEYPKQIQEYKQGNKKIIGFLMGQIMKKSNGNINPQKLNNLLEEALQQIK